MDALHEMTALLPKHKGTEKLHAELKKRLAKLEEEGEKAAHSGGRRYEPGHVHCEGAGQWVLLGPPNADKSSLLKALIHAHPEIADYSFTYRVSQLGMMLFEDVQMQLVDTPAVAPGHTEPWLVNLTREADGLLLTLDLTAVDLEASWSAIGALLQRAHVWPAARSIPEGISSLTVARPVLVVANKCDLDRDGTFTALARDTVGTDLPFLPFLPDLGDARRRLPGVRLVLFRGLRRIRVYTKEPGHKYQPTRPFVLAAGATVYDLAWRFTAT